MAIAWIAVGVVLLAVELHHFAFYALFAAVGCFAGAAVAVVAPDAIAAQVIAAVLVAVVGIVLVRPRVSAAMLARHGTHRGRGVHGGFVGHEVVTLDVVGDVTSGRSRGARRRAMAGRERCRRRAPARYEGGHHRRRGDDAHRLAGRRPPADRRPARRGGSHRSRQPSVRR